MQSLMISKHSDNIDAFDLKLDMNMDIYSVLYRNIFNSNKILILIRTAAYQKSICHIDILYAAIIDNLPHFLNSDVSSTVSMSHSIFVLFTYLAMYKFS